MVGRPGSGTAREGEVGKVAGGGVRGVCCSCFCRISSDVRQESWGACDISTCTSPSAGQQHDAVGAGVVAMDTTQRGAQVRSQDWFGYMFFGADCRGVTIS